MAQGPEGSEAVSVDSTTIEEVWKLFDSTEVEADVALLIAAALEGDEPFHDYLGGRGGTASRPDASAATGPPVRAFIKSVSVTGFRGIGEKAELTLAPYPGLTVISGRNGTGKSSFSEGLEFAVAGSCERWNGKKNNQVWQESWRNLHRPNPCNVGVSVLQQPDPQRSNASPNAVHLGVKWDSDDLASATRWAKPDGGESASVESILAWDRPTELYRPILSYEELGSILDQGPGKLYDALNQVLGLEEISNGAKRIDAAHKDLGQARAQANKLRTALRKVLTESADPRAGQIAKAIGPRPDVAAVRSIIAGAKTPQDTLIRQLRSIADLVVPTESQVAQAISELKSAIDGRLRSADDGMDNLTAKNQLLADALAYQAKTTTEECPVCDTELPKDWVATVAETVAANEALVAGHMQARTRLRTAEQAARDLVVELPLPTIDAELPALAAYRLAVDEAQALPDSPAELAAKLSESMRIATAALRDLQVAATARADEMTDEWAPVAEQATEWLHAETRAQESDDVVNRLKAAKEWLRANGDELRSRRMVPIAEHAKKIWGQLRQQSDVALTAIELGGANTRRHVNLEGTVDGKDVSSVLSVMSQGELHALALTLFIPRATMPASPFGFLVLDDPIQAMDPAKIDGLLDVLTEVAKTRQVIVFSHDDRLPSAIRKLGVEASLLTVTREPGSRVTVDTTDAPADRYVKNAEALLYDKHVPDGIKHRAGPGLFRMAVESAARQQFYGDAARRGLDQAAAEELWESNPRTKQRVALALGRDPQVSLGSWQNLRAERQRVMQICTRGTHEGDVLGRDDIRDLRKTVGELLGRRP